MLWGKALALYGNARPACRHHGYSMPMNRRNYINTPSCQAIAPEYADSQLTTDYPHRVATYKRLRCK